MKKLLSLVLAMALIFSLVPTIFAAAEGEAVAETISYQIRRSSLSKGLYAGEHHIPMENGKLSFTRSMIRYPEEAEPSSRSWRWEYALVWGKDTAAPAADAEAVDCRGICFASPAERRRFRDLVRGAKTSLHLVNVEAGLCREASHTGRKQTLIHQDTGELLTFYIWANRTLLARGLKLTAALTAEAAENRPALAALLGTGLQ